MTRRIVSVALMALTIVLMFAMTANAKPGPHFVTHGEGTLDQVMGLYVPEVGIPYAVYDADGDYHYELVEGYIDVTIDVESIGNTIGHADYDGSDYQPKWHYNAKGLVTAEIHITDPAGNLVDELITMEVKKVTICGGQPTTYFLDVKYRGEKYNMYVGESISGYYNLYLPFLGQFLGKEDGIYNAPLLASMSGGADFSFVVDDDDLPPPF